jgi:hypothetical protein
VAGRLWALSLSDVCLCNTSAVATNQKDSLFHPKKTRRSLDSLWHSAGLLRDSGATQLGEDGPASWHDKVAAWLLSHIAELYGPLERQGRGLVPDYFQPAFSERTSRFS